MTKGYILIELFMYILNKYYLFIILIEYFAFQNNTDIHMTHIHLLTDMTGLVITLTPTIPTNITIINITRRGIMENHLLDIMRVEISSFLLVELLELVYKLLIISLKNYLERQAGPWIGNGADVQC